MPVNWPPILLAGALPSVVVVRAAPLPQGSPEGERGTGEGQHGGEGDLAGGEAGGGGSAGGEPGDHVMGEQERPGFLADEGRGASAQGTAGTADGPLQVEERDFDYPSFLVQDGEFPGGMEVRVEQRGQEPDLAGPGAAAAGWGQHGAAADPPHPASHAPP